MSDPALVCVLAFDPSNRLAVRKLGSKAGLAFTGTDLAMATARLEGAFSDHTSPSEYFPADASGRSYTVFFAQVSGAPADAEIEFWSIEKLAANPAALAPSLAAIVALLEPHLVESP